MKPLTSVLPKPMMPFRGSTLIADGILKIKPHITNVHITVGYKGATLASHVIQHDVSTVFNTEGKGNAWWIYNTMMKHLREPTFVLTCDNVCELDFARLTRDYFDLGAPACMVVPVEPVEGLDGDFIFHDAEGFIDLLIHLNTAAERIEVYVNGAPYDPDGIWFDDTVFANPGDFRSRNMKVLTGGAASVASLRFYRGAHTGAAEPSEMPRIEVVATPDGAFNAPSGGSFDVYDLGVKR